MPDGFNQPKSSNKKLRQLSIHIGKWPSVLSFIQTSFYTTTIKPSFSRSSLIYQTYHMMKSFGFDDQIC